MRSGFVSSHPHGLARLATLAMLVASATGCAGARRAALRDDLAPPPEVSSPAVTADFPADASRGPPVELTQAPVEERVSPERVAAQVRTEVAQRMSAAASATHRKVATTVLAESNRAGVDPLLVVAMIHVESSFNPRARSHAGALGLMQVRVPTLRQELNRPKARRADALDPHTNVQAGVRYFHRLLETFGATDLALMAYNAGPGRIQRLLARGVIPPSIREYSRKVEGELERIRNALLRPLHSESTQP